MGKSLYPLTEWQAQKVTTYLETLRWYNTDDLFQRTIVDMEWRDHPDWPDSMPLVVTWDDGQVNAIAHQEVRRIIQLPGGRPGMLSLGFDGKMGNCMWCGAEYPLSKLEAHEDACH